MSSGPRAFLWRIGTGRSGRSAADDVGEEREPRCVTVNTMRPVAGPLAQVADALTAQQAGKKRFPRVCTASD